MELCLNSDSYLGVAAQVLKLRRLRRYIGATRGLPALWRFQVCAPPATAQTPLRCCSFSYTGLFFYLIPDSSDEVSDSLDSETCQVLDLILL